MLHCLCNADFRTTPRYCIWGRWRNFQWLQVPSKLWLRFHGPLGLLSRVACSHGEWLCRHEGRSCHQERGFLEFSTTYKSMSKQEFEPHLPSFPYWFRHDISKPESFSDKMWIAKVLKPPATFLCPGHLQWPAYPVLPPSCCVASDLT